MKNYVDSTGDENLKEWFDNAVEGVLPPCNKSIGWIKIAFSYAVHYLNLKYEYEQAI